MLKAIKFFSGVQAEDGHWPAECSGVLTLAPGMEVSLVNSLCVNQPVKIMSAL